MTHIDFHPGNVLVRLGPDDMPELSMIDLDALRQQLAAELDERPSRTWPCSIIISGCGAAGPTGIAS